jgi:hypothetical protein
MLLFDIILKITTSEINNKAKRLIFPSRPKILPGVGNTYSEQKPLAGQTGRAQTMYSCFLSSLFLLITSLLCPFRIKLIFVKIYLRCVKNASLNNPLSERVSQLPINANTISSYKVSSHRIRCTYLLVYWYFHQS